MSKNKLKAELLIVLRGNMLIVPAAVLRSLRLALAMMAAQPVHVVNRYAAHLR
ncbi:MAG: hypothetical protein JWP44_3974 [Mucilaginibacter sp.]|nr:hypothetical protein [Mucilaginibacter sp.]